MNTSIQQFLDELYEIDPTLRSHESDLLPIIQVLLKHNPGREPDASFVEELRGRLQTRAAELSGPRRSLLSRLLPVGYVLAGGVLTALILNPNLMPGTSRQEGASKNGIAPLFSYNVTDAKEKNAFGALTGLQQNNNGSRNQSGGGGGAVGNPAPAMAIPPTDPVADTFAAQESATTLGYGGDTAVGSSRMMIAPDGPYEVTQYEYTYSGSLPALPQGTVSVLERQRGMTRPQLSAIANQFNLGMLDIGKFSDAKIDNITVTQEKDMGYMLNLQLKEGSLNINQNWEKWPHPEQNCRDEACYRKMRTTLGQLLSRDDLIKVAGDFVAQYGLDVSKHGKPEVDETWKHEYDRAPDKTQAYVPDVQTVVYPQLVDGKPVYDQGGQKAGIRVNVNVRQRKVSDVWGIQNQNYLRSEYDAISGNQDVTDFLNKFERYPKENYPPNAKIKTVKVTLGAPTISFVSYFKYTNDNSQPQELVIPALIFPVTSSEDAYFWRQIVAVPLAKELLNDQQGMGGGIPMPLIMEDAVRTEPAAGAPTGTVGNQATEANNKATSSAAASSKNSASSTK